MGVKDLWNIITPLNERKPLYELHGKAVAIDLSGWVVDSQTITDNHVQPKMYLRNLFFRTSFMLQQGIFPVFVLEGTAPDLKHKTMAKRNEIRNGTQKNVRAKKGSRSQFNSILRQCEQMLNFMGLFCLRGKGEAEAMCAYLDQVGFVDGCISQDSDCFLYGAKKVYRNFCTKSQGYRATSQGTVDEYTMEKIEQVLNLGRNKMIDLALLCGCDYDTGVSGVGKEAALKLFKTVKDEDILERLKSWSRDAKKFERMEREISDPNICTLCGHDGKMRSHLRKGCIDCGTDVKCNETFKEKRALINNELVMRKKALLVENFPSQDIIDEYLIRKEDELSTLSLKWKQPKVHKFIDFMVQHLAWEPEYAFAKIFPLMTQWQIQNLPSLSSTEKQSLHFLIPKKIQKIRKRKGILCYEIVWRDQDKYLAGLILANISDEENDKDGENFNGNELISIEKQEEFAKCYPQLVEEFEESRKPKKKTTTRKRKAKTSDKNHKMDEYIQKPMQLLQKSMENLCISPNVTPKRKKRIAPKGNAAKKHPQVSRVLETEMQDNILNGSLEIMFNDSISDNTVHKNRFNMSEIIDMICGKDDIIDLTKDELVVENNESITEAMSKMNNKESDDEIEILSEIENEQENDDAMSDIINRICNASQNESDDENYVLNQEQNAKEDEDAMSDIIDRICNVSENESDDENYVLNQEQNTEEDEDAMSDIINRICSRNENESDSENDVSMTNKVVESASLSLIEKETVIAEIDLTQDEFDIDEVYVPLNERIKNKNVQTRLSMGIDSLLNSSE